MPDPEPTDFTKAFLEAGFQLSERDRLRDRFLLGSAPPPRPGRRLSAGENFLADVLADPHLAAACAGFFPAVLGLPAPAGLESFVPGELLPWGRRPPAGDLADPLEGVETEGLNLVRDFQGRVAALLAGAAVSGAAPLVPDYVYSHTLDGRPIVFIDEPDFRIDETAVRLPRRAGRVLILGFVRGPEIMGMNPGLSRLRPPGGWLNWPGQAAAVLRMADFLKSLGCLALPSAGGLMLADHLGALAGLGELGRQGLLITPEYGPNLRLLTIITDFPFELGQPATFGVADYCETCQRCINECPAKALTEGHRRPGLYQWPVNRRACFDHWLEKRDPCRKCIEVCPYTREPLVGSPGGQGTCPGPISE